MSYVRFEKRDTVALLSLDHESENRFHPALLDELLELLDTCEKDQEIWAVVLTGANPKYFSNGLDLAWLMENICDMQAILGYLNKVNATYRRICVYPKPVVAALNGHTFAGGAFLAAHADFRFMREDRGWVCLPEVDINIPLLPGMVSIMRAVTSPAGFRDMYYTGRRFTAREALATGYVDRVYSSEDLLPQSLAFAAMLGAKKTATYAEMKKRLRGEVVRVMDTEDAPCFLSTLTLAIPS